MFIAVCLAELASWPGSDMAGCPKQKMPIEIVDDLSHLLGRLQQPIAACVSVILLPLFAAKALSV